MRACACVCGSFLPVTKATTLKHYTPVDLEDLKAGNVENADKVAGIAHVAVKRLVDALHNPQKETLVHGLGQRLNSKVDLQS